MLVGVFAQVILAEDAMAFSRRDFLTTAVVGSLSLGLEGQEQKEQDSKKAQTRTLAGKLPIIVSSANGYNYLDDA